MAAERPDLAEEAAGWLVVRFFNDDGEPLMARIRRYDAAFDRARYPHRINIFWPVAEDAENGMPTPSDLEAMARFESRLTDALERDGQSTLSLVVTGGGEREWVLHTEDPQQFLARLSAMPHEDERRYPVEITHEPDADWALFEAYLPGEDDTEPPPGTTLH